MKIFPEGKDRKFYIQLIIAGLFFSLTKILYQSSSSLGYFVGFCSISGLAGYYISGFILKRYNFAKKLFQIIAWSSLITWVIPVIGVATSTTTFSFLGYTDKKTKYKIVATVCLILSIVNGLGAFYLAGLK